MNHCAGLRDFLRLCILAPCGDDGAVKNGAVSLKGSPPKKQRPGSCVEPGFGVLFRCERKQNASGVHSIRD